MFEDYELPKDWKCVKLGDICIQDKQIIQGNSLEAKNLEYYSLEHIESGSGRILEKVENINEEEGISTTFRFDERHVLYGKLRPYLNKVALPNFTGRCTTEIIPLLPLDNVDRYFLAFFLRRSDIVEKIMREITGSRMPRANMSQVLSIDIPLPPFPEQKRIVKILQDQFAAVETARVASQARLEAIKALPAAYLREVFPGPGQPLPSGWQWINLGDICDFIGGSQPPKSFFKYQPTPGYIRLVQIQDFRLSNVAVYIPEEMALRTFDTTDVMIGRYGPPVFQIFRGLSGAYNVALIKALPRKNLIKDYLYYLLQSPLMQKDVIAKSQRSAGQSGVQKEFLQKYKVALPPTNIQEEIANILNKQIESATQTLKSAEQEFDAINRLTSALLNQAFRGEL